MEKDQRELLFEFNARGVKFLVIGGYAYSHYTEPRATKDLDLFVEATEENASRVFAALLRFGAPIASMSSRDFEDLDSFFQLGVAPNRIDILQHIDGVDFDAAWAASEPGMIGDNIPVRYISFDHLVKNKLTVGRTRDLADVEDLRAARAANSNVEETKKEE